MTRFIVYFEPVDIEADTRAEATDIASKMQPIVSKIVPAVISFDVDIERPNRLRK